MRKFVRVIAVLLILTSVGILGFEYWEYSQFKEQKEELVEISNTFVPPVTNTDPNRITMQNSINSFWLSIRIMPDGYLLPIRRLIIRWFAGIITVIT
jgi:hypothetical protein